jgi:hypothetical protein
MGEALYRSLSRPVGRRQRCSTMITQAGQQHRAAWHLLPHSRGCSRWPAPAAAPAAHRPPSCPVGAPACRRWAASWSPHRSRAVAQTSRSLRRHCSVRPGAGGRSSAFAGAWGKARCGKAGGQATRPRRLEAIAAHLARGRAPGGQDGRLGGPAQADAALAAGRLLGLDAREAGLAPAAGRAAAVAQVQRAAAAGRLHAAPAREGARCTARGGGGGVGGVRGSDISAARVVVVVRARGMRRPRSRTHGCRRTPAAALTWLRSDRYCHTPASARATLLSRWPCPGGAVRLCAGRWRVGASKLLAAHVARAAAPRRRLRERVNDQRRHRAMPPRPATSATTSPDLAACYPPRRRARWCSRAAGPASPALHLPGPARLGLRMRTQGAPGASAASIPAVARAGPPAPACKPLCKLPASQQCACTPGLRSQPDGNVLCDAHSSSGAAPAAR